MSQGKEKPPCGGQIPTAMFAVGVISPLRAVVGGTPSPSLVKLAAGQNTVNRTTYESNTFAEYSAAFGHASFACEGGGHRHQVRGRWRNSSTRAPKRKSLPKSNCARPRNTFSRKRVPPTGCQAGLVWPSRRSRSP